MCTISARSQGKRLLGKSILQQIGQFFSRQSPMSPGLSGIFTTMARMTPSCSNITWAQSLRRSVMAPQTYGRRLQDSLDQENKSGAIM